MADFEDIPVRAEGADRGLTGIDRFSIRWDVSMGCYRVSVPELSANGERIEVVRVDALKALLAEMELHDDLPDSFDLGYMQAWSEVARWLDGLDPSKSGGSEHAERGPKAS